MYNPSAIDIAMTNFHIFQVFFLLLKTFFLFNCFEFSKLQQILFALKNKSYLFS